MKRVKHLKTVLCILLTLLCLLTAGCTKTDVSENTAPAADAVESPSDSGGSPSDSAPAIKKALLRLTASFATASLAQSVVDHIGESDVPNFRLVLLTSTEPEQVYQALMNGEADLILAEEPDAITWAAKDDGGYDWEMLPFALRDGTFVYAVIDAGTPENSPVRSVYEWFHTDEAKVLAEAEGYTLPES